jgi:glutamate carboxypeptidase
MTQAEMTDRLIAYANMNTGSANAAGLDRFRAVLRKEFEALGGQVSETGGALSVIKRPDAPRRVFLCIHTDTVYPADHPFQTCTRLDEKTLQGPGVADAKGGIVVMLAALQAFEKSPPASKLGWEVLLNPDEEIGSLGSWPLLKASAARNQWGLLFEPATADGALISRRKGSGNFSVVVRGRSAHAGRDFAQGRNAVAAMAELAVRLHDLNGQLNGVILNIGRVEGGGPTNVVPDWAAVHFNIRTSEPEDEKEILDRVEGFLAELNTRDGIRAELKGCFHSPPKIPDQRGLALMKLIERCGNELDLPIHWKESGGACDGNKLAAAGLPNVDTMGPCGGNLHSDREFVLLESLPERAKLAELVLEKLAESIIEA